MELESRQSELLEQFCLLAKSTRGRGIVELISQATAEPGLFAYEELLDVQQIKDLEGTEHAKALDLLRLFAFGTLNDYKASPDRVTPLQPAQILKLKQLTVMMLAETRKVGDRNMKLAVCSQDVACLRNPCEEAIVLKVLPYDILMDQLDVTNVRELEDLLINHCMYSGIIRGKLDQRRRCFEVQIAAGRDLRPGQLDNVIATLDNWVNTSESLLQTIQDKIKWADNESEQHSRRKKEMEEKAEEMKKLLKTEQDIRGQDVTYGEGGATSMDYVEDGDRSRPKRRR